VAKSATIQGRTFVPCIVVKHARTRNLLEWPLEGEESGACSREDVYSRTSETWKNVKRGKFDKEEKPRRIPFR